MEQPIIYTVGHSTHSHEHFLSLLKEYGVNCLVDVRSVAASGFNPQYNKAALKNFLHRNGIQYLHFAAEFGARKKDAALMDDRGRVDVRKVWATDIFRSGVHRLRHGVEKGFVIALMCAESEPLNCHRFHMISVALARQGFEVRHILKDKSLKMQVELEQVALKNVRQAEMFG